MTMVITLPNVPKTKMREVPILANHPPSIPSLTKGMASRIVRWPTASTTAVGKDVVLAEALLLQGKRLSVFISMHWRRRLSPLLLVFFRPMCVELSVKGHPKGSAGFVCLFVRSMFIENKHFGVVVFFASNSMCSWRSHVSDGLCTNTGQMTVNTWVPIRYIIPINDVVHRPL